MECIDIYMQREIQKYFVNCDKIKTCESDLETIYEIIGYKIGMKNIQWYDRRYRWGIGLRGIGLRFGCMYNIIELVKYHIMEGDMIVIDPYHNDSHLYAAGVGGNIEIIEMIKTHLPKRPTVFDISLGGYIDVTDKLVLEGACAGRHKSIVVELMKKEIHDYDTALQEACHGGDMDIIRMIMQKSTNYNRGLIGACKGNNMEIVKFMISNGAKNFNQGIGYTNDVDIMELLIHMAWGQIYAEHDIMDDSDERVSEENLCMACLEGDIEKAKLMIRCGAVKLEETLCMTCMCVDSISESDLMTEIRKKRCIEIIEMLIGMNVKSTCERDKCCCKRIRMSMLCMNK